MTCILKSCPHAKTPNCASLAKSGLGECGAAFALELAGRNDGYLVHSTNNPTIAALKHADLIYTRPSGADGYVIARAVQVPVTRNSSSRWVRAVENGAVVA